MSVNGTSSLLGFHTRLEGLKGLRITGSGLKNHTRHEGVGGVGSGDELTRGMKGWKEPGLRWMSSHEA
jgi:hypothetical protein